MLWLLTLASPGLAAEVDAAVGYHQTHIRDEHQSPLPYAGHGTLLQVGATQRWDNGHGFARLSILAERLDARAPSHPLKPAPHLGGAFEMGAMPRVTTVGETDLLLGGGLRSALDFGAAVGLHPWAVALNSVDLHVATSSPIPKGRVDARVSLPVTGLITRHVWSLDPISPGRGDLTAFYAVGTEPFTVATAFAPRARIQATRQLGDRRTHVTAGLDANLLLHAKPRPVRLFSWAASVGLSTRLGKNP